MKKFLSLILTAILLCSVAIMPVSAETVIGGDKRLHTLEDAISYWEQQLGYEIPTKTYYFYFPDSWKFEANEYYDASVGLDSCLPSIYWYGESTANPDEYKPYSDASISGYPGYMLTNEVAPNIYKAEIPADVKILVFSNGVCEDKAGDRWCEGWQFSRQVGDTETYYSESDWYGFYPNGLETVENMILVPDQNSSAETSWRPDMFAGSWFYYYGDGKYGYNPTLEEAGEKVYSNGEFPRLNSDSEPIETVPSEPASDNTEPTEPSTPESNVTVETEPNNHFGEAQSVVENQVVSGGLSGTDVIDIYSFTLEKRQMLTLYRNIYLEMDPAYGYMSNLDIKIYKNSKWLLDDYILCRDSSYTSKDENGKEWDESTTYILDEGTYYMTLSYLDMGYEDIYEFMYELRDPKPILAYKDIDSRGDYDGEKVNRIIRQNRIEMEVGGYSRNFVVLDGEVAKWKTDTPKKLKVTKKGKVTALSEGYGYVTAVLKNGEEIKCTIEITGNPEFTYKYNPITYINLKKGKTKTIRIENDVYKIKKVYKGNENVKVTGKANASEFKIKGLKKGLSVIKVKVNRNWYRLTVNVK